MFDPTDLGLPRTDFHVHPHRSEDREMRIATACPETAVWRSVIIQACHDLYSHAEVEIDDEVWVQADIAAEKFLFEDGPDFREVCELASLAPERVHRGVRHLLKAFPTPPPPSFKMFNNRRTPEAAERLKLLVKVDTESIQNTIQNNGNRQATNEIVAHQRAYRTFVDDSTERNEKLLDAAEDNLREVFGDSADSILAQNIIDIDREIL